MGDFACHLPFCAFFGIKPFPRVVNPLLPLRLILLASLLATPHMRTCAGQAPGLLWSTSVGAQVFAVDTQTNVYANAGGAVIELSGAGVPLKTNADRKSTR